MEPIATSSAKTTGRLLELDLLKTFTIIVCMIPVHCWLLHTDMFETTLTSISCYITGGILAAPVFMYCMGLVLSASRKNEPRQMAYRGIILLTFGAVLSCLICLFPGLLAQNVEQVYQDYRFLLPNFANAHQIIVENAPAILTIDILQFAGLACLLMALFQRLHLKDITIVVISVAMSVIGQICVVKGVHSENQIVNQILCYFILCGTNSCFPLFSWFIFVAAGKWFGKWYLSVEDKGKLFRWLLPVGCVALAGYICGMSMPNPIFRACDEDVSYFYGMSVIDSAALSLLMPWLLGFWWLVGKILPKNWLPVLTYPSRHITKFYCVSWVLIVYFAGITMGNQLVTTDARFLVDAVIIVALTTLCVVFYNKYLVNRTVSFLSKHSWSWIAAVWLVWFGAIMIFNI